MLTLVTYFAAAVVLVIAEPVNIFKMDITPEEAQQYLNSPPFTEPQLSGRTAVLPLVRFDDPRFRTAEAGPTLGHYWKNGKEIENTDDYLEEVYKASQFHGQDGLGAYTYGYKAPESSKVENRVRSGDVTGSYVYKAGSSNDLIKVRYWADSQGFHQEDNLPKYQPQPVQDTEAVKLARIAHEKAWKEAADANLHPYAYQQQQQQQQQQQYQPYSGQNQGSFGQNQGGFGQNQGTFGQNQGSFGQNQGSFGQNKGSFGQNQGSFGQNQGSYGQNQGSSGQNQGGSGQNQYSQYSQYRESKSYSQNDAGQYNGQQTGQQQYNGQHQQYNGQQQQPNGQQQQHNGQQQQFPGQQQQSPGQQQYNGQQSSSGQQQYGQQSSFGQQQNGGNQNPGQQYQGSASNQYSQQVAPDQSQGNLQESASSQHSQHSQGNLQASASTQQSQYQTSGQNYDGQQSASSQQYQSTPPQFNGQGQNQYNSQQQYSQQNQGDDGQYHEKYQDPEATGPPRGFFYSFDYPVSIISPKNEVEGGASNSGHPVDHDTVAVSEHHQ